MKTWMVTPSVVTGEKVEMCGLDLMYGFFYFDVLQFFTPDLDVERFRTSLGKALDLYPVFTGRAIKQGGRLFVDCNGHGVPFTYAESERKTPDHGPSVFPVDISDLQHERSPVHAMESPDQPLAMVLLKRFSDGHYVMRLTMSHAVTDGSGYACFLGDWSTIYEGGEATAGAHSRKALVGQCLENVDEPSARYGARVIREGEPIPLIASVPSKFSSSRLPGDRFSALQTVAKEDVEGKISVNHLLSAMVLKALAKSAPPASQEAILNSSFDIRFVKGFELPKKFYGNAVLLRSMKVPREEALDTSYLALARRVRDFNMADLNSVKQDVSFYQNEYSAGRFNMAGGFSRVAPMLLNGGVYLNNIVISNIRQLIFGETGYWGDLSIGSPFSIRMAMIHGCRNSSDVVVRLGFPPAELEDYKQSWDECVNSVLSP